MLLVTTPLFSWIIEGTIEALESYKFFLSTLFYTTRASFHFHQHPDCPHHIRPRLEPQLLYSRHHHHFHVHYLHYSSRTSHTFPRFLLSYLLTIQFGVTLVSLLFLEAISSPI